MESQGERWEANGKEAYLMGANLSLYLIQNRRMLQICDKNVGDWGSISQSRPDEDH